MRLLYNSLNIHYALSVRLLALMLLVSTVAAACTTDVPADDENASPENKDSASDTTAVKTSINIAPATIEFLGNPFVASRSQSNSLSTYYDKIQDDFTIDADAIENLHRAAVTDTIYTIRFGDSMLEFYAPTQTGELHLQMADIRDSSISMRNNIKVGISQADLMGKLRVQNLLTQQTQHEVIARNREGAPSLLHFYLKNGKVSRILYEGYID